MDMKAWEISLGIYDQNQELGYLPPGVTFYYQLLKLSDVFNVQAHPLVGD